MIVQFDRSRALIESKLFDTKWLMPIAGALWAYYVVDGIKKWKISGAYIEVRRDEKPIHFWLVVVINSMMATALVLAPIFFYAISCAGMRRVRSAA